MTVLSCRCGGSSKSPDHAETYGFLLLTALAAVCFLLMPEAGWAAEQQTDAHFGSRNMDVVLTQFVQALQTINLSSYVTSLFWTLAGISLVWQLIQMLIATRSEFNDLFAALLRWVLFTGVAWLFVNPSTNTSLSFWSFFSTHILSDAQNMTAVGGPMTPSTIVDIGLNLVNLAWKSFSVELSVKTFVGAANVMVSLAVFVLMLSVAVEYLIMLIGLYVLVYVGVVCLGFAGSSWTRDFAVGYFKAVFMGALQLIGLMAIVYVAVYMFQGLNTGIASYAKLDEVDPDSLWTFVLQALIVGIAMRGLAVRVPQMLAGILSGNFNYGAGGALGGAVGMAAAGASIAAGALGLSATAVAPVLGKGLETAGRAASGIGAGMEAMSTAAEAGSGVMGSLKAAGSGFMNAWSGFAEASGQSRNGDHASGGSGGANSAGSLGSLGRAGSEAGGSETQNSEASFADGNSIGGMPNQSRSGGNGEPPASAQQGAAPISNGEKQGGEPGTAVGASDRPDTADDAERAGSPSAYGMRSGNTGTFGAVSGLETGGSSQPMNAFAHTSQNVQNLSAADLGGTGQTSETESAGVMPESFSAAASAAPTAQTSQKLQDAPRDGASGSAEAFASRSSQTFGPSGTETAEGSDGLHSGLAGTAGLAGIGTGEGLGTSSGSSGESTSATLNAAAAAAADTTRAGNSQGQANARAGSSGQAGASTMEQSADQSGQGAVGRSSLGNAWQSLKQKAANAAGDVRSNVTGAFANHSAPYKAAVPLVAGLKVLGKAASAGGKSIQASGNLRGAATSSGLILGGLMSLNRHIGM